MPKTSLHPQYYPQSAVTCSCGASYAMGSTKDSLKVDICKECHPFYTGNQKLIDTAGRVDRFREKMAVAQAHKEKTAAKPVKPVVEEVEEPGKEEA